MRHIIPISGKDSLATAIMQMDNQPQNKYEFVFNPVGFEFPESIEWLLQVEKYLGIKIIRIGVDLKTTAKWQSGFRPGINSRYCTSEGKIKPMEAYVEGEGYVYYGLRADEPERIGYINKGKSELTPLYPLRTLGYGLNEVLDLVNDTPCKPPAFFWQLLHDMFIEALGEDFLLNNLTDYQRTLLFAWRVRQNCYNCFFMRRYEWVGLHYFHPDLFFKQVADEENHQERKAAFFTIPGLSLRKLLQEKDNILERHVKTTSKKLMLLYNDKQAKGDLFNDLLSFTSCGLLCGK